MPDDRIPYSAVLADLESRRNALNTRISSIDAAIEGIRTLLDPVGLNGHVLEPTQEFHSFAPRQPQQSMKALPASTGTDTRFTLPPSQPRTAVARSTAHRNSHNPNSSLRKPVLPSERRKNPGLNIYVNHYPEWTRKMSRGNLTFRKKAGTRCPKCGSADTRESTTRGIADLLMLLFDYSNARCRSCDNRFRIWKARPSAADFVQVQTVD